MIKKFWIIEVRSVYKGKKKKEKKKRTLLNAIFFSPSSWEKFICKYLSTNIERAHFAFHSLWSNKTDGVRKAIKSKICFLLWKCNKRTDKRCQRWLATLINGGKKNLCSHRDRPTVDKYVKRAKKKARREKFPVDRSIFASLKRRTCKTFNRQEKNRRSWATVCVTQTPRQCTYYANNWIASCREP